MQRIRGGGIVVSPGVGRADVEIGGLTQIFEAMTTRNGTDIALFEALKDVGGVAAEHLTGRLQIDALWRRQTVGDRESRVIDAIFPAYKVPSDERTICPRQHM